MPCSWIVWADIHRSFKITAIFTLHHSWISSENMSLKCRSGWQLNMHLFFFIFFFFFWVQVLKRSSFTYNCFRGQAGSQQRFHTEAHEWAYSTAGMCFCAALGKKKSRRSEPLFPTVRFKTSSRQIWHHYFDSNHNSLCLNVSDLNYKDRCDKRIFFLWNSWLLYIKLFIEITFLFRHTYRMLESIRRRLAGINPPPTVL